MNKFAISSGGVGEAMQRSAAAMEAAGNTIDETLALIASMNTVVQNPESVGTTLKTVSMYLRAAKTEAESAGESTDGMAESVSKLRKEIKALTGNKIDIMQDEAGTTFKSTFQILRELSKVWDQLSDVSQANILERLAGKRNSNALVAVIKNFDIAEKALIESQNAAGSAMAENEKYLDSIDGKLNQLKASWEQLSNSLLNSGLLKGLIDGLRMVLDFFNNLDEATNGVSSKIIAIVTALTMVKAVVSAFTFKAQDKTSVISALLDAFSKGSILKSGTSVFAKLAEQVKLTGSAFSQAAKAGASQFLPTLMGLLPVASKVALAVAGIALVITVVSKIAQAIREANPTFDDLKKKSDGLQQEVDELSSSIETANERIKELKALESDGSISLVEQDELTRLENQNELLEARLKLKEALLEAAKAETANSARNEYEKFFANQGESIPGVSGAGTYNVERNRSYSASPIQRFELYRNQVVDYDKQIRDLTLNMTSMAGKELDEAETKLQNLTNSRAEMLTKLAQEAEPLQDILSSLDPEKDADAISNIKIITYQIEYLTGDVTALQKIWGELWSDDSASTGLAQAKRELEQAANISERAFEAVWNDLDENGSLDYVIDAFSALGVNLNDLPLSQVYQMFVSVAQAAEQTANEVKNAVHWLTELSGSYNILSQAQTEVSDTGKVSASTLEKILTKYPALQKYLIQTADGYTLTKGALDNYISSQRTECQIALNDAQTAAQKLIDAEALKKKGIDTTTASMKQQLVAMAALYESQFIQRRVGEGDSVGDARRSFNLGTSEEYQQAEAAWEAIKKIEAAQQSLADFNSVVGTLGSSAKTSGGKSSSDSYKDAVNAKIDALKHQLQMEQITSEQYYDGLEIIEKKYYKDSKAHMTTYASEIRSIDEELFSGRRQLAEDWLSYQEKLSSRAAAGGDYDGQQRLIEGMMEKVKKMISDAFAYGLTEASDYVMELRDKLSSLQDDMLSAVQSPYEKYISYMDDFDLWDDIAKTGDAFSSMAGSIDQASSAVAKLSKQLRGLSKLDVLKQQLKDIDQLYKDGKLSWEKYVDAHNNVAKDIYDTQKDSLQTVLDLTMEMIKQEAEDQVDAIEKQVDAYQKIIDLKKQLLQDSADEQDHEEQVAEKVKEIADLQSKIAQLSLDDSREATAKRASLAEELQQKQKELADLQKDYALDQTIDALDKSQEAFEDEKDAEKKAAEESVDSWAKLYQKAIKRINGNWDELYRQLSRYEQEHRDSIDGPNSLVTAWQSATSAMKEYNNNFEDAYNNAPNKALNPNAPNSPEAQAILKQMQENSNLAKAMGRSDVGGRNLHEENNELAARYEELTGQHLEYNNGWRLDNKNGAFAYEISASKSNTSTSSQPKDTSSGGEAYKATVAKFKTPPTGTLKEGSSGDGVKWLQYYLKQLGLFPYAVDGQFYSRTKAALKQFQAMAKISQDGIYGSNTRAALPKFHTGGIVGNAGAINDHEVLALLKKGEWVLDDTRKQNLKNMFANLKVAASELMSSTVMSRTRTMRPAAVTNGGDTFAPHIEVNIQHNGQMTDKDAKQYGNVVASTALEQLRTAFVKRGKT